MYERLTRRDWTFIGICLSVAAVSLFVVFNWFNAAFPEAAIDFRFDREASREIGEKLLRDLRLDVAPMKHAVVFNDDDSAKLFLERSLGLERANAVMRRDVHVWFWQHRWFQPEHEEELRIDVAPTGEIVAFNDRIPEAQALPAGDAAAIANRFLALVQAPVADLQLVSQSERQLPHRLQRIFTWESKRLHPGGAPYRYTVVVDGNRVSDYSQRIRVPEEWLRGYEELRSKNILASDIDQKIFLGATILAVIIVFIVRLRRGDVRLKMIAAVGAVTFVLVAGTQINSYPEALASFESTSSFGSFLAQYIVVGVLLNGLGAAVFLMLLVGAGEVLYRERLPQQLALPRLWTPRALQSRRVFLSFILGYTLVAFFLGYQVSFYLIADQFGAWSPAEIPYDEMLNSAIPWVAVLFAGFMPALSEEMMCRAFSIPFIERLTRSRLAAIVIAGFIWGFGHANYANQPFYIRGVEVGLAGVVIGSLFYRFGLLPLLIWHYTVDALYTALLLLRSGNRYYVISGGLASLVFAVPMLISIVQYIRHRGFVPDEDLSNASLPVSEPPPPAPERAPAPLPPGVRATSGRVLACVAVVAIAVVLRASRGPSPDDAVDYRITADQAKALAGRFVPVRSGMHVLALPVDAFRSWDPESPLEEGGAPHGFDGVAANYLVRHGLTIEALTGVFRDRVRAAVWNVRFFVPRAKEEYFVEVDPRQSRVTGYHKYQSETNPGPRLEQPAAQAIAMTAFPRFGADASTLELKEALSFQQPNRRDWLFHFQERTPIAGEGYRRVSVRVAGAEVTQFAVTVKVPDAAYREAAVRTITNTLLLVLKILGGIAALASIVAGLIIATRKGFPWKRPAKGAAFLAIIPILLLAAHREATLFGYRTSEAWSTFLGDTVTGSLVSFAWRAGAIFLALAGIEAAVPFSARLLSREGRARFGRAGVTAALTALGLASIAVSFQAIAARHFPSLRSIDGLVIPPAGISWPALTGIGEAIVDAIAVAAAAALMAVTLRPLRGRAWMFVVPVLFCILIDSEVSLDRLGVMVATSAAASVLIWLLVRYVLADHYLAWPAAAALLALLHSASVLLPNHRADLQMNAWIELAAGAALILWLIVPRSVPRPVEEP